MRKDWMSITLNLKAWGALPRSQLWRRSNTNTLHLPSYMEKGHFCFPHASVLFLTGRQGCTRRLINTVKVTLCPHGRTWRCTQALALHSAHPSRPPRRGCSLFPATATLLSPCLRRSPCRACRPPEIGVRQLRALQLVKEKKGGWV